MRSYPVNVKKLIEMLGPRTYENQFLAGVRETIVNALDQHADTIIINWNPPKLKILNNGKPLLPDDIEQYITIASDHIREPEARGEFGWGHICLIGLSSYGIAYCPKDDQVYKFLLMKNGYEHAGTVKKLDISEFDFGFGVEYDVDKEAGVTDRELCSYLEAVFAIPLLKKQVKIILNENELKSKLLETTKRYVEHYEYGMIEYFYMPVESGFIYYAHKDIGVRYDTFTGLIVYVNERFLSLTISKEQYVTSNPNYRDFRKKVAKRLQTLIPQVSNREKVMEFMKRLEKLLAKKLKELEDKERSQIVKPPSWHKNCPLCGASMKSEDDTWVCPECGHRIEKHKAEPKERREHEKKLPKGPKGWRSIRLGITYPFLWIEPSTRLIMLNETHPICKDTIRKLSKSLGGWQLRPFIQRAIFALQVIDSDINEVSLRDALVKTDVEYAKILGLKIEK